MTISTIEKRPRPWCPPALVRHASLTELTLNVSGFTGLYLLQAGQTCSGVPPDPPC
ncbi:MAG TPA: hypothetical protein VFK13_07980 [Gemmatimonadaceae bacterium]|nr:hypothetical protein [Gemmatimonadaceae bacterium]